MRGDVRRVAAAVFILPVAGQSQEPVDYQAIYKIKEEGLQRSKVMEITSYLTDVYGPRLTGSPNIRAAGEWAVKEMQGWGLANAKLEQWGPFGRGWSNDRFVAHLLAPSHQPRAGPARNHVFVHGDKRVHGDRRYRRCQPID